MSRLAVVLCAAALAGCVSPQESGVKVIVGARLEQSGKDPIDFSVVIIQHGKIQAVGPQATTPVPKGAEITGGLGMAIQPIQGGRIEPGQPANLVLNGATKRFMRNGEWADK